MSFINNTGHNNELLNEVGAKYKIASQEGYGPPSKWLPKGVCGHPQNGY